MRHRKSGVKLNRTSSHRQAMFRNMVTSLLKHDRIKTTDAKAKELRRWADHVVTLAKRGDLHARRLAMAIVREKDVVHKLFEEAAQRFGSSNGGYTRIVKIGHRPGDTAPLTLVELISSDGAKPARSQEDRSKTGKSTAAAGPDSKQAQPQSGDTPAISDDNPSGTAAIKAEPVEAESGAGTAEESPDAEEKPGDHPDGTER